MKLVRRVRSGARKLESFRSFGRKRTPNKVFYAVPPEQGEKTKEGTLPSAAAVDDAFLGIILLGKQKRLRIPSTTGIVTLQNCAAYLH